MKTALITGASQGIGAAIANELNKKKNQSHFSIKIKKEIKRYSK